MNQLEALNRALFLSINAGPNTATWLINSAILVADGLIYLIPALMIAMWLWGDEAKRNLALKACLVAMVGVGMNQIIGLIWNHPRPFMIGLGHSWLRHATDSSFPSDHVTVFSAIGISLLLGGMVRLGLATLVAGLCVAFARVFLGVHYPLDMVGAIGVACLTYFVISLAWRRVGKGLTQIVDWFYWKIMAWPVKQGWVER